jgi:hypothetical protein
MASTLADQHVELFNSKLKRLVKTVISLSKMIQAYAYVNGTERQLSMALDAAPLLGIDTIGPFLEKYASQIEAHDEKFFLTANFESDIAPEYEEFRKDIVMIMGQLKDLYKGSDTKQRDIFHGYVEGMLHHSREYASLTVDV